MKYAITDIGSNTVKISFYRLENGEAFHVISQSTPLGLANFIIDEKLSEAGMSGLCSVLESYRLLSDIIGAEKFICVATASLRNISNTEEVVSEILRRTGLSVRVIDGDTEARLGFVGFSEAVRGAVGKPPENGVFIDMGGGSTELVSVKNGSDGNRVSLNFGALKLYNKFVSGLIPTEKEKKDIYEFVSLQLKDHLVPSVFEGETVYLSGGTSKMLGKVISELFGLEHGNMAEYSTASFRELSGTVSEGGDAFIHRIAARTPERIHMLLPGLCAYLAIFDFFNTKRVYTVYSGIRDGFIVDILKKELYAEGRNTLCLR